MRRHTVLIAACALLCASHADSQFIDTTIQGLSSVPGTGARALGMGGAFIAVADDATAASWNPAGLAQLDRPEVSLTLDWTEGDRTFDALWVGEWDVVSGSVEQRDHSYYSALNNGQVSFVSGTYPLQLGAMHSVVQISYRRMLSFPDVDQTLIVRTARYDADNVEQPGTLVNASLLQKANYPGAVDTYAASFAAQLSSKFRVGLTLGYVTGGGGESIGSRYRQSELSNSPAIVSTTRDYDFDEVQADIGLHWTPVEPLTIGAVYHTGFDTSFEYRETITQQCDPDLWGPSCNSTSSASSTGDLKWPAGWGLGIAWRPTSRWIVSADYSAYEWSKAEVRGLQGAAWDEQGNPIAVGLPDHPYPFYDKQNDTWAMRLGAEWTLDYLSAQIPLRVGIFREKMTIIPADVMRDGRTPPEGPEAGGFSLGAGLVIGGFQVDIGWIHSAWNESYPITLNEDGEVFDVGQTVDFTGDHFLATFTFRF
jgi:long-subunit fatty acid transport protein